MTDKKRKKEYKELFEAVRAIFIERDPMGFIAGGSPKDEYDAEVGKILPALKECSSEDDVRKVIQRIFQKQFDVKATTGLDEIANEIYRIYSIRQK